ncbi:phage tail protein [Pseudoalteromonas sp. 2CM39R]|uniref:phage tail protein n=1 Tax=Pseudoalteromonas sp. 2CM39R TaxID=2929856 RepID=UPI0020BFFA55|nr:phage tail protein [Pseudoalteromonas sp. 2CM39R]MCK8124640.1 phage tail protein [Pseudoalteromonas sp. 2CM39R]
MSQTISQLQQVCEFLVASLNGAIRKNNIDAWQERGKLIICNSDQGQDGYLVARWKHTAIIAIEKFPHKKVNPYNLFAMVCAFLIDSGWQRDEFGLDDPEIDIDLISDDNATVLIELELMDDIELIPDDSGPVQFNGGRYYVSLAPINVAENVDVDVVGRA